MKNSVLIAVSKVADKPHYMVRSALLNTLLKRSGTSDMKVSVISVFGDGWTLLKLLKSYAKHRYKDGGPENVEWWSMKDETEGEPGFIKTIVRIMPEIIIADTQASGKIAIVIVGSPLNEPYSLEEEAIAFSINALSSSCLIFPTDRNISGNNLDRLNLLAAYSRQVHKSQDDYKSFQKLLFLVKDWDSPSRFEFGLKGGQQYLIESVFHHSEKSVDQLKICQNLKMSFEEMECVLMSNPHPRRSRGLLRKSLNTRDQLEKEYLDQAKQLVQHVLSPENLCKKRINGELITVRELFSYLHKWVDMINTGVIPDASTLYFPVIQANCAAVRKDALKLYINRMVELGCGSTFGVNPKLLEQWNEEAKLISLTFFDKGTLPDSPLTERYKKRLIHDIDQEFFSIYYVQSSQKTINYVGLLWMLLVSVALIAFSCWLIEYYIPKNRNTSLNLNWLLILTFWLGCSIFFRWCYLLYVTIMKATSSNLIKFIVWSIICVYLFVELYKYMYIADEIKRK